MSLLVFEIFRFCANIRARHQLIILVLGVACCCSSSVTPEPQRGAVTYYIDSQGGDDTNDGTAESEAWKSLSQIGQTALRPGDVIRFRRGSSYTGTLEISHSGTPEAAITLTDYGDPQQPAPAFTNPVFAPDQSEYGNCIRLNGRYIIVENLYFHHTPAQLPSSAGGFAVMWELGAVHIARRATNCIVRNNEFFDCGVAIKSNGEHTRIAYNFVHDCNRVLKEWSWGPIGIWIGADYQEVHHNRIFNYRAVDARITWGPDSYGGGADGGAIEIDDARFPKSNISIHHNFTRDNQGFLEVTWKDVLESPAYGSFAIHHNVSDDYQQFVALWRGERCRIENNTIIRRKVNVNDWGVFNITQYQSQNLIRNNIVIVENEVVVFNVGRKGTAQPQSVIQNNLYYAAAGSLHLGEEGPGPSAKSGDPLLKDYDNASSAEDFSLSGMSPAVDAGMVLEYERDFQDTKIPQNTAPDIGAFEYVE